ncbi:RNA-binding protein [archaeon]|nr:MAG: RNA-binding protein [archaeon]
MPSNSFVYFSRSYLDKTVSLHLNKNRKVVGTLRGYDQFMNLVLGNAVEEKSSNEQVQLGMVVSAHCIFC